MPDQEKNKIDLTQEFRDAYYKLPMNVHLDVKRDIIKETYWSESLFYSRVQVRRFIKEIEVPIIKRVFEKYGYEIFK